MSVLCNLPVARQIRGGVVALLLLLAAGLAHAQAARVLVVMDPADEASGLLPIMVANTPLPRLYNGPVTVLPVRDLRDAMRATRTGENDVIVGPAHVIASALAYGYQLVAASGGEEKYVLVATSEFANVTDLKGHTVHFPGEDSLRSYVGRGLLTQGGLSVRALKQLSYGSSSVAGLMSLGGGRIDAAVASEAEWNEWSKTNPKARLLASSRALPAGFAVAVKADASPALRRAVLTWVTGADGVIPGVGRFVAATDAAPYVYVASLGIFTPQDLAGVQMVSAPRAADLAARGAQLVDVRTEREFAARHARGSINVPYGEKSLKEPQFDDKADSFAGLAKLRKDQPVVFLCNGAECWKSYKASKVARDAGFATVYWLRGGVPEWTKQGLPTVP